jgi:hypothetical protein
LISASAAYSVVVLPEPVGPVTSTMPDCAPAPRETAEACRRHANAVEPAHARTLVEQTHHRRLAIIGGQGRQPHVNRVSFSRTLKRPSCGKRFSEMSSPAISFSRCARRSTNAFVSLGLGLQHAVHPHSNLQTDFLGLDMNVRGADLHGVFEQRLQQTDHRRALQAHGGGEFAKVNRVAQVFSRARARPLISSVRR